MSVVSLLTDFKLSDGFIGSMKAVILQINPKTEIVDLAHEIPSFSLLQGAFVLNTCYSYFPEGTVFCVVVDPGVGTKRRAIAVETEKYYFVGSDNGVLFPSIKQKALSIRALRNERYFLPEVSHTFHGRDIFAPVSAHLSKNEEIFTSLGPKVEKKTLVKLNLERFSISRKEAKGEAVRIDGFGNVITNLPAEKFWGEPGKEYRVVVGQEQFNARFVSAFGKGREGELLLLEENHGFLQMSLKQASASEMLNVGVGEEVTIYR